MFRVPLLSTLVRSRHPTHRAALVNGILVLLGMAAILLAVRLSPQPDWLQGSAHYPPLHMAMESLAVVIASLVFVVGWKTYLQRKSSSLLTLACLFLGVAVLDFSHMLSYQGMPDFVTPARRRQ